MGMSKARLERGPLFTVLVTMFATYAWDSDGDDRGVGLFLVLI